MCLENSGLLLFKIPNIQFVLHLGYMRDWRSSLVVLGFGTLDCGEFCLRIYIRIRNLRIKSFVIIHFRGLCALLRLESDGTVVFIYSYLLSWPTLQLFLDQELLQLIDRVRNDSRGDINLAIFERNFRRLFTLISLHASILVPDLFVDFWHVNQLKSLLSWVGVLEGLWLSRPCSRL